MPGTIELWLTTDSGKRIAQLSTGLGFSGSKIVNGIGEFTWIAPASFDRNIVKPDMMLQVWYEPFGGIRKLWNVYFLRRFHYPSKGFDFGGPDINGLLWRRIVAAYTNTSQAKKTAMPGDDMMKEVVRESLLDNAAPTPDFGTRAWADLTVQADNSLGPTISKSFPFNKLLTFDGGGVLPILARASAEAGTQVFFAIQPNIVSQDSINFEFRTFINYPGSDVSTKVIFDEDSGSLLNPDLTIDHSREENYIYATGQGTETNRDVQQVWDAARIGQSRWGRSEGEADSRNDDNSNAVIASGYSKLFEGRPKITFTGKAGDTEGTAFVKHWDVGDLVRVKSSIIEFPSLIRGVTLSYDQNGKQSVDARLDYNA